MSQVLKKEIQEKLKTKYISDQSIEWLEVNFSTSDKINLTIVSSKFDKLSYIQRKEQVIESLKQYSLKLGLLSLYTTEESDHLGIFPPSTIEDLSIKTWQDLALLAANPQNQLKQAKSSGGTTPRTVTFYSFKGGVGRTTALNHVAWLLAKRGRKVVAVDLDFEAPGLSTSFNLQQSPKYGLVDYFYDRTYLPKDSEPNVKVTDIFGEVHISDATGRLFIVPAGFLSLDYISKVDDLNATAITGEGKTLWDTFKKEIDDHLKPDLILIDSRTGINKWGALSLLEAAKEIIIFLYPNEQNFLGVQTLFRSLQCLNKIDINFVFSPVPDSEESGKDRVNKIIEKIKQSFQNEEEENQEESNEFSRFAFFTVPYLQPIALSDKYPSVGLVDYYQPIANLIDEEVSESLNDRSRSYNSETRWQIIEDLRFPSLNAAAADQELKHLFQKTANFEKFLDETTCLIKGRKGTGKTALYFLLLKHTETAKKLARHRLDNVTLCSGHGSFRESRLTRDDFLHIDKYLTANQSTWEVFWRSYLLFSLYTDKKFDFPHRGKSREKFSEIIDILRSHRDQKHWQSEKTEALIRLSTSISSGKNLSLLVSDALNLYNEDSKKKQTITWLLYDELDEDFPASIRKQALTGLFQLIQSCDARGFKNIRFKVFLREDIWNDLNFENKSHFNGRDLILEWTRSDFLKLALRLATRSTLFKELLDKNHPIADIDEASEAKVSEALDILWGTRRRKGDKAKYVTRWVYERLTDSSGRTFPRSLTALLDGAKTHELTYKDNPSIQHPSDRLLRSQSLEEGLRKASIERCEAIKQEYENLVSFFDSLDGINAFLSTEELQTIWNQHLNSHDIRSFEDFTNFLENIGVIQWRGKENRYRFVDLYIYGFKLNYQGAK